jgi:hypothetical protein
MMAQPNISINSVRYKPLNTLVKGVNKTFSFTDKDPLQWALENLNPNKTAMRFYTEFEKIFKKDPQTFINIFKIMKKVAPSMKERKENIKELSRNLAYLSENVKNNPACDDGSQFVRYLQKQLKKIDVNNLEFKDSSSHINDGSMTGGGKNTYFQSIYDELITKKDDNSKQQEIVNRITDHPIYGEDTDKISTIDRAIFIAITFLFRGVALFITRLALNTYTIYSFKDAFAIYVGIYLSLFILLVILVNTGNIIPVRLIFYYIDSKNNGWKRIIIHIILYIFLLIILVSLNAFKSQDSLLSDTYSMNQKAHNVYNTVSYFTTLSWFLTSVIAFGY